MIDDATAHGVQAQRLRALHPFEQQSVAWLLQTRAALSRDDPFLVWAPFEGAERRWTYGEFADDVARVAGGLRRRGVERDDRVIVLLENCPESLLTFFACAWLGAVCVPVNASSTPSECAYFVARSEAVGIVTQPSLREVAYAAATSQWVVVTDGDGATAYERAPVSDITFASLFGEPIAPTPVASMAPASVLFTSGTTSRPKGVVWTQANVLWGAKMGALQEELRRDDVHLVFLPLFHVVALTWSILPVMWAGASAVLQPKFSASRFWEAAVTYRCTWASMVPFCTAVLAKQPVPEHHFRCWGHAVYSKDYEERFRVKLLAWWGMTEIVTQGLIGEPRLPQTPGSIGRPSVGYEIAVFDDEGAHVGPGGTGELSVRGRPGVSLFLEYLGDQEATRTAFDDQGYFRTGDRARVREDGTIQFVDRLKDVIKVGGESVAAPEVERVIGAVPGVHEVAVVAKRDPDFGEVPVAFVRASSSDASQDLVSAVFAACRQELAKFKVPREVVLVNDFPRVAIGKIAKAELRKRLMR
jgi:carnitine-CoA ligase